MSGGQKGLCLAAFLAAALFLGGCGDKKEAPQLPQETYGVADLETLVKAHPDYASYFKLEAEYKGLLSQYQAEQKRLTHTAAARQKMEASLHSDAAEKARREEYETRIRIKEESLNSQLRNFYNEIENRHRKGGAPVLSGALPDESREIANLQMKLKVLRVSGEEKDKAQARLDELLKKRYAETEQHGWTAEEKKQMEDRKAAASAELASYAEMVAADIRKKTEEAEQSISASPLPEPELWNQEWEDRLKKKQGEMAAVKEKIMKDIREKAAETASERHLVMIFSSYRANVTALDVTGDIVNELVQMK